MKTDSIIIKNAHTNNLKHVDIELPKHRIVVFMGVSGSLNTGFSTTTNH